MSSSWLNHGLFSNRMCSFIVPLVPFQSSRQIRGNFYTVPRLVLPLSCGAVLASLSRSGGGETSQNLANLTHRHARKEA
jgi:hypothetical protein